MLFRISISDGAIFKLEEGLVFRNKSWSFVTGYSNKERGWFQAAEMKRVWGIISSCILLVCTDKENQQYMLPDLKQITKIVRWEFTWLNWFEKKKKKMLVCTSITKKAFSVSRYSAFLMCTMYLIAFWTRTWADLNKSEQTVVAAHNFPYSSVSCRYFWLTRRLNMPRSSSLRSWNMPIDAKLSKTRGCKMAKDGENQHSLTHAKVNVWHFPRITQLLITRMTHWPIVLIINRLHAHMHTHTHTYKHGGIEKKTARNVSLVQLWGSNCGPQTSIQTWGEFRWVFRSPPPCTIPWC